MVLLHHLFRPARGGEPLWLAARRPREFRHNTNPGQTCENRRLPGTAQRFAALWSGVNESKLSVMQHAGLFPGAALLRHFSVEWSTGTNIARWSDTLQSRSPPGAGNKHLFDLPNPFEDEYEYDWLLRCLRR